jgi:hypothetical protein
LREFLAKLRIHIRTNEKESLIMEETRMQKVAFVIRNNACYMVPGHIVIDNNEDIRFSVNGECKKVTIVFPDPGFFQNQPHPPPMNTPFVVVLDKNPPVGNANPSQRVSFNATAPQPDVCRFTAYCDDTKSFAIGGSDPEIIIQT